MIDIPLGEPFEPIENAEDCLAFIDGFDSGGRNHTVDARRRPVAYLVGDATQFVIPRRTITEEDVGSELSRLESALREAEQSLRALQQEVQKKIGKREAQIFDAQILLLRDPTFVKGVSSGCLDNKINVEAALADVIDKFSHMFAEIDDPYLRERAGDIRDVGRRVLDILLKHQREEAVSLPEGVVLVASELLPSTSARLNLKKVRGVVTERGGRTSHASILTRSLGIPSVIAATDATKRIKSGDALIVDGLSGIVYVNPRKPVIEEYVRLEADFLAHKNALKELIDLPSMTQDGVKVKLCANIGKLADAEAALLFNADGIGLYRTEFNFLIRDHFPTDEEQYEIYESVAKRLHPREVVIRVLDVGSDKILAYFPLPPEPNPSLGCGGTRLLLKHPEVLMTQLRAILRVGASHSVGVLFPMIGSIEEVIEAKRVLERVRASLQREHPAFNPRIRVGVMIETPSAALTAKQIAQEVDFFSIGTNDLVQYLLTADRSNPEMASYYEPLHPAVLHMIKLVIDAAHEEGKEVSVSGEMAGNPLYTRLLLGLGVRNLSVTPGEILEIKKAIRSMTIQQAEQLVGRILKMGTIQEIKNCVMESTPLTPLTMVS